MAESTTVDWDAIEREYRGGILSLREIASLHPGTNHVAITRRAKRENWARNLGERIRARAEELVTRQAVTGGVTGDPVTERQIIETNAQAIVLVKLQERKELGLGLDATTSMLSELAMQCGAEQLELLDKLGEIMANPDAAGKDKLGEMYRHIISLPGRAKTLKDIIDSYTKLFDKRRTAMGLSDGEGGDGAEAPASALTDAQRASRLAALLAKARKAESDANSA